MAKVWAKHWVTLHSRPFSHRIDAPLLLLSIEKATLGQGQVPVTAQPQFRHYMSNVFIYLMPPSEEDDSSPVNLPVKEKGLVHGWELKIGMPVEEAKQFAAELLKTVELCEKRREERHAQVHEE